LDCYKAKYKTTSEERKNNVQLYFSSKFAAKPAPHLEPINYDPWAQLEFKHELTGA
jgi:hypothetical protein